MNEIGRRLAELCVKHELVVIGGTQYPQKTFYKNTWTKRIEKHIPA